MGERVTHFFNKNVASRTAFAKEALLPEYAEAVADAGLTTEDLELLVRQGTLGEEYDRRQRDDLNRKRQEQKDKLDQRRRVEEEDEALRNRLPAVVKALSEAAATSRLAGWLADASFARYRLRTVLTEVPPAEGAEGPPEQVERRELTESTDLFNRFQAISQFTSSLLEAGREPIVEALAARRMGRERLETLRSDVQALVDALGSPAQLTASDWTRLEADAVKAQKEHWTACQKMLRALARDNERLKALWADC